MPSRNRGKKKPKLRDLSQVPPTFEEQKALLNALAAAPPIARAILGAVMVEHELEMLLRRKFPRKDDDTWSELLSDRGPLGTFHQKIVAGYAFGIYDDATLDNLHIVRSIRNAFAHSKKLIDFDHELIVAELKKSKIKGRWLKRFNKNKDNPTGTFSDLCLMLAIQLGSKHLTALKISATKKERATLKRTGTLSSYAAALAPFLQPLPAGSSGFGTLAYPGHQSGDPIPSVQFGLLSESLPQEHDSSDNEDKEDSK